MTCGDGSYPAAWSLFAVATLVSLILLLLLIWAWYKYRDVMRTLRNKEKAMAMEISNPINTHRWGSPDSHRDQPGGDEEEHLVGAVGGGGGGSEGEEIERSESGSYIRAHQVGRDAPGVGGGGGGGGGEGGGGGGGKGIGSGGGKEVQPRNTSGSIMSTDYTDNRDRWTSPGQQHHQQQRTIILPLSHQPVPGLSTLVDDTRSPRSSEVLEDYVHMSSVTATNQYMRDPHEDNYPLLARLTEDRVREREEGRFWDEEDNPADYEKPISKDGDGDTSSWIQPRQKGSTVPPSLSGAIGTATGSKTQVKTHGYINVAVKKYDPDNDLFCSSVHHKDVPLDTDETPESILEETTSRQTLHPPYVNIDGESLPPEDPPVPKRNQ